MVTYFLNQMCKIFSRFHNCREKWASFHESIQGRSGGNKPFYKSLIWANSEWNPGLLINCFRVARGKELAENFLLFKLHLKHKLQQGEDLVFDEVNGEGRPMIPVYSYRNYWVLSANKMPAKATQHRPLSLQRLTYVDSFSSRVQTPQLITADMQNDSGLKRASMLQLDFDARNLKLR